MCLAIPGKIIAIFEKNGLKMGRIDYGGTVKSACLEYVPAAKEGDFVVVHAGFALNVLDPQQARETLRILQSEFRDSEKEMTSGLP